MSCHPNLDSLLSIIYLNSYQPYASSTSLNLCWSVVRVTIDFSQTSLDLDAFVFTTFHSQGSLST